MNRRAWLPLACGLATAAATWWAWGAWRPLPESHDENAYLLQAGIFAQGRWADPPPPLPEFFEQMHVLSEPTRAAKYPPGHSLVLAPGVRLGMSAAVPMALAGAAGAGLVALARRAANARVAILAWLFWLAPPHPLQLRASYLSQATTTALWLLGWWALLRWTETARTRWLGLLSACVAWGCITRPLTTIAFALPAAAVVLRSVRGPRLGARIAALLLPGAAILLVIPLWSERTTGDPLQTPIGLYIREYLPFDRPGLGPVATQARRELPPDLRGSYIAFYKSLRDQQTLAALPVVLGQRLAAILRDLWGGWRLPFLAFTLLGFVSLPRIAWPAVASAGLLVGLHLAYAHYAAYTLYYVEAYPVFAFVTALGVVAALERLSSRTRRPAIATGGLALIALALAAAGGLEAGRARASRRYGNGPVLLFHDRIRRIPDPRAIVFVRYAPDHDAHRSLIVNGPDLAHSPVWVVYDRGADNARLCLAAPDRAPYLYDEGSRRLVAMPRDCAAPSL